VEKAVENEKSMEKRRASSLVYDLAAQETSTAALSAVSSPISLV
jgi:hypothetical protein